MDMKIVGGLVAGALLLGLLYVEMPESGDPGLPAEYTHGPEALKWLLASENESALASNRFLETPNAIAFVRELYRAGAKRVIVPQESITDDGVEIYADALVVTLPDDAGKRQRVWKLRAAELKREGNDVPATTDEKQVFLWWD
jgi:hypothetical protein